MASSCSKPDFRQEPSKFARLRRVASGIESLGDWRDVIEMLNFKEKGGFWGRGREIGGSQGLGWSLLQGSRQASG